MSDKTVANEALHEESAEARRRVLELEGVARDGTAQTGQRMPDKWEACRENEARFRSLVETTSDWLWEVDAQCIYTYASPKLTDLLGYAPEEVLGKKPFDLMPADEARRVESLMASIFSAARAFSNLENLNRHKNGRLVYLETSGIPILDETGGLLGYRGIDRDISDRKRAMEVLRESEENYRILFETMAQGVVYQDAQGR
ncbi:MAG TPA: PAS domain S-box protein, partial [Acidobacteriota bacterium]|nr:PAS domain S-box protein [Acidobacteriota bacterium]